MKRLLLAAGLVLASLTVAYAAGYFPAMPAPNLPLTGAETAPFDTQLSGGQSPQTEAITTAQLNGAIGPSALTDAATITPNLALSNLYTVTLGGNRTLANPTNLQAGRKFDVEVTQDGTGSRTLAYGSLYKWAGGTAPTLTTTSGHVDVLRFLYDGTRIVGTSTLDVR